MRAVATNYRPLVQLWHEPVSGWARTCVNWRKVCQFGGFRGRDPARFWQARCVWRRLARAGRMVSAQRARGASGTIGTDAALARLRRAEPVGGWRAASPSTLRARGSAARQFVIPVFLALLFRASHRVVTSARISSSIANLLAVS